MKIKAWTHGSILGALIIVGLLGGGCSSTPKDEGQPPGFTAADGSKIFRRTDKIDRIWLAEGFDFTGYDALLIEPATVDPGFKPKDEKESERLTLAQSTVSRDLILTLDSRKLFKTVAAKPSEIPEGAKVLKLQPVITKFSRGSTAMRIGVGMGAGLPYIQLRTTGTDTASGKEQFLVELDETADMWGAGFSGSQSLQTGAALELTDDVANFISRVAKHEPIKYK